MKSTLFVILLAIMIIPSVASGTRHGVCYEKVAKNSKHIFFGVETGKKVMKDIKSLGATKRALGLEKGLLKIAKENNVTLEKANKNCGKALKDSKKALLDSSALVLKLKGELQKSWDRILTLKGQVEKYKRSRTTYLMVGVGIGAIVAGGIAIGINGLASNDAQLRAGLIGTGAGGVAVGATLIGVAILR